MSQHTIAYCPVLDVVREENNWIMLCSVIVVAAPAHSTRMLELFEWLLIALCQSFDSIAKPSKALSQSLSELRKLSASEENQSYCQYDEQVAGRKQVLKHGDVPFDERFLTHRYFNARSRWSTAS